MNWPVTFRLGAALAAALGLGGCASPPQTPEVVVMVPDGSSLGGGSFYVDFIEDVAPLLESRCLSCHRTGGTASDLSFETFAQVQEKNVERQLIIPGEPERSSLFLVTVIPDHYAQAMPKQGHRLDKGGSWLIYQWILLGAEWPEDIRLEARQGESEAPHPENSRTIPDITSTGTASISGT